MKIGAVSQQTGLGIHTIRFYETQGLIIKPNKDISGHRNYSTQDIELLNWIACMKNSGMPLNLIRQYSQAFYQQDNQACLRILSEHLKHLTQQQLDIEHYLEVTQSKITRLKKSLT